jgi:hypothetical protein
MQSRLPRWRGVPGREAIQSGHSMTPNSLTSASWTCPASDAAFGATISVTLSSVAGQPSSIQSAMKAMSASATRVPPQGSGGNRLPSNGGSPRSP